MPVIHFNFFPEKDWKELKEKERERKGLEKIGKEEKIEREKNWKGERDVKKKNIWLLNREWKVPLNN